MNEQSINDILNGISLIEVMRANGYEPERLPKGSLQAVYLCPMHSDHSPSLMVDRNTRDGADKPGWHCFGCGRKGYGAVALQAQLMGFDHSAMTHEQWKKVAQRLVDDHGVETEGVKPTTPEQRTKTVPPQECEFDLTTWTQEHLRALGFSVKLATENDGDGGQLVKYKTKEKEEKETEGKIPLYRCSIDRGFWKGKGEILTAEEWGQRLEHEFSIFPVETFVTNPVQPKQGGKCSLSITSTKTYPIFVMTYNWGVKKYEPKNSSNKWYWSTKENVTAKVYGDSIAVKAIEQAGKKTTDKPWFTDALEDAQHPLVITEKDKSGTPLMAKMRRLVLCSGPRDAMQMWAATDAHVLWLHNEIAGIRDGVLDEWLRMLLVNMTKVAADVYVCYDIDETGTSCSASIALENPNIHWMRLPKEMMTLGTKTERHEKAYKDVTDFVTHFAQVQKLFSPDIRKANPSEALMRLMKNALTMQFWIDKATTKKTREGEEKEKNVRYVLAVANMLQFLEAKGIRCHAAEKGQRAFYQLSQNNTYRYLDTVRTGNQLEAVSRTAMLEWIDAHITDDDTPFRANLINTVFTGKGLDQRTMSTMQTTELNEHSYGEDFDCFFFQNVAVRVTKDAITPVPYTQLTYITNEECILPGNFQVNKQPWRIVIHPKYEEEKKKHEALSKQCKTISMRAAENMRWTQWQQLWKYKLIMDKPLEEMPMHFRFLYNLGRVFWEKESFGEKLTETEKQMQDMHFINKAHAIGYAITRHRSRARQQIVHLTDYAVSDEQRASGRNGKSAVIDMLAAVRPSSANVAGKSINGTNLTLALLLGDVVAGVHTVVGIDELPEGFKAEELYNAPIQIVVKTLYKQPVTLRGEEVPKLFIASNKPFDRSSGSTKGRIYPCFTSDYYHAATDDGRWLDYAPKDEFMEQYGVQEVANGLPEKLMNELRNMMLACAQFFFQQPTDTILPPQEARSLRRELYAMSKDAGLTDWLLRYFENTPDNPHIGLPIPLQEMAISLLDNENEAVSNDSIEKTKKRINKYLKPCLNRIGIVMDPDVVLNTATYRRIGGRIMSAWATILDQSGRPVEKTEKNKYRNEVKTGERVPRELQKVFVHYFYRNEQGCIPTRPYTKGHEYDEGYVQGAPEIDPEARKDQ